MRFFETQRLDSQLGTPQERETDIIQPAVPELEIDRPCVCESRLRFKWHDISFQNLFLSELFDKSVRSLNG